MKKSVIIVAAILFAGIAHAQQPPTKPIPVEFTLEEIKVTIQMIDACVKAQGLGCSEPANAIVKKLNDAVEKATPKK